MAGRRCIRNRTAVAAIAWALVEIAVVPATAAPRMPGSYEVSHSQSGNLSWRETGTLPMSYASGMRTMKATLEEQGYVLEYEIPLATGPDGGPKTLMQWNNGAERILMMLWEQDGTTTGCSWGVNE